MEEGDAQHEENFTTSRRKQHSRYQGGPHVGILSCILDNGTELNNIGYPGLGGSSVNNSTGRNPTIFALGYKRRHSPGRGTQV